MISVVIEEKKKENQHLLQIFRYRMIEKIPPQKSVVNMDRGQMSHGDYFHKCFLKLGQ